MDSLDRAHRYTYCGQMHPASGKEPAHPSSSFQPELVLLGLLIQQECHGYELYRRFSETLAGLWHISESQMYATLKRLEEKNLLTASSSWEGLAVSRRILSPTSTGRVRFESWLASPSPCRPRALKLEFLSRLYFASVLAPDMVPTMIEDQRNSVLKSLQRIQEKLQKPGKQEPDAKWLAIRRLADVFTTTQLRSTLEWIDVSIIPVIKGDTQ